MVRKTVCPKHHFRALSIDDNMLTLPQLDPATHVEERAIT
jgi:hypothetical protein